MALTIALVAIGLSAVLTVVMLRHYPLSLRVFLVVGDIIVMAVLWLGSTLLTWQFESQTNPQVQVAAGASVSGGNLEGKEVRFGIPASGAFAAHFASTAGACSPIGRSRYSGGFFGFGDHAAADASCARSPNGSFAESAGVLTASSASSFADAPAPAGAPRPPLPRGDRQQGLMM